MMNFKMDQDESWLTIFDVEDRVKNWKSFFLHIGPSKAGHLTLIVRVFPELEIDVLQLFLNELFFLRDELSVDSLCAAERENLPGFQVLEPDRSSFQKIAGLADALQMISIIKVVDMYLLLDKSFSSNIYFYF